MLSALQMLKNPVEINRVIQLSSVAKCFSLLLLALYVALKMPWLLDFLHCWRYCVLPLTKFGHVTCQTLDRMNSWGFLSLSAVLEGALWTVIMKNNLLGDQTPDTDPGWFSARNKLDSTTQRLIPVIEALYAIQIILTTSYWVLDLAFRVHPASTIVPRWKLAMVGILIANTAFSVCALVLWQIIDSVPLNIAAVIAKLPNVTPEDVQEEYNDWWKQSKTLAILLVMTAGMRLALWVTRLSLGSIHWADRHKPTRYPTSDGGNATVTMELVQVGQSGGPSSTRPLAALFEAHEEIRARERTFWMMNEG